VPSYRPDDPVRNEQEKRPDRWLKAGDYASRPPGELHGPFKTDVGCVVLEVSFLNRDT
jgi:hypothetical protein